MSPVSEWLSIRSRRRLTSWASLVHVRESDSLIFGVPRRRLQHDRRTHQCGNSAEGLEMPQLKPPVCGLPGWSGGIAGQWSEGSRYPPSAITAILSSCSPCDVLVLDLAMSDKGGMDVLKQIRSEMPKLKRIIIHQF